MPSTSKTEYDPAKRVLSVWFVASGKRYDFEEVPAETYKRLSVGVCQRPLFQRPHSQSLPLSPRS
ncbi:KTSC domain-containing protein [Mesorhizobium sp. CA14]|uniref:KTSC domain-containing protein n=1 Tax=Mesorhizobium sp. CA14 TaxID=2876642 RepID=UPI001CCAEF9A|nr:KTSC domain-containing protein [Mesorhizobium sp. CA14]MBZ9847983.1 KTSC domain-containing protein [Mesorhizobium sp. CA14]